MLNFCQCSNTHFYLILHCKLIYYLEYICTVKLCQLTSDFDKETLDTLLGLGNVYFAGYQLQVLRPHLGN